jgi:excisionase family DNA binding protein
MATTEPRLDDPADLLSVEEAARRLRIGCTTMYSLISAGEIETVTIGRRRLVPPECRLRGRTPRLLLVPRLASPRGVRFRPPMPGGARLPLLRPGFVAGPAHDAGPAVPLPASPRATCLGRARLIGALAERRVPTVPGAASG